MVMWAPVSLGTCCRTCGAPGLVFEIWGIPIWPRPDGCNTTTHLNFGRENIMASAPVSAAAFAIRSFASQELGMLVLHSNFV
jgi:hypothetical protein